MIEAFDKHLSRKVLISLHAFIILSVVLFSGMAANRLLHRFGLKMGLRYPLTVLVSYLVFYLMIRIWLGYVRPHLAFEEQPETSLWYSGKFSSPSKRLGFNSLSLDASSGWELFALFDFFGVVVVLLLGWGFLALAVWLIFESPIILSEAAFQMAISAGLIRGVRKVPTASWKGSVWKRTAFAFLVYFFGSALIGFVLQVSCPQATTIYESLSCSRLQPR